MSVTRADTVYTVSFSDSCSRKNQPTRCPQSDCEKSLGSLSNLDEEAQTHWMSIYSAALLSFISAVQFSLYLSNMWPYMQMMDEQITETFFGSIVSAYSVGQILASPLFGWWSNRVRGVSPPLLTGLVMMIMGNLLYILMPITPFPKRFVLMFGRLVTGVGSGNVALLRTYASTASTTTDRSQAITLVTCGQALGMVVGPVFQLLFTPLGYPGLAIFGERMRFNLYSAPAYFACLINVLGMALLKWFFVEKYVGIVENAKSDSDSANQTTKLPSYDVRALVVCYVTRFTDVFVRTNLETLGAAFAMMMFSLSETQSVAYNSAAQGVVGFITFLTYLVYIKFRLDQKYLLISALVNGTDTAVGCNSVRFDWCAKMTAVNIYLYYGSYAIVIGLAFPILTITMNTLFSRVLGPRRQGTEQGLLQGCSGLARLVGPLSVSALYTWAGPRPVWALELVVLGVVLFAWLVLYGRMVPFEERFRSRTSSTSLASALMLVQNEKSNQSV